MKTGIVLKKAGALLVVLILLVTGLALPAYANDIHGVEVWVDLHSDGSATVTESWDINMTKSANTEWYVAKHKLDRMEIRDLVVVETLEDGSTVIFETLDRWEMDASRAQKAGKCGLVRASGGYEICWGFGDLGRHTYTVTYTITDIIKGYDGGDAMSFNFLSDAAGGADFLNVYLRADDFAMEYPETRVWVFGCEAESTFEDEGITIQGQGRFRQQDYAAVLLVLDPGLLAPVDQREDSIDWIIERELKGSIWEEKAESSSDESYEANEENDSANMMSPSSLRFAVRMMELRKALGVLFSSLAKFFPTIVIVAVVIFLHFGKSASKSQEESERERPPTGMGYCRELPFGGNLEATYARLYQIDTTNESSIIGCFLLKWLHSHQVGIVTQTVGILKKREETAIQIYAASPDMPSLERELYDMVTTAAGKDYILQSREFEKWARKNYYSVGRWLDKYRMVGKRTLIVMGVYEEIPVKSRFGSSTRTKTQTTPHGHELTNRAYGFRLYLEEFTIINEREAREVELWGQYLIFAQLFGIADRVAEQFRLLYPAYFTAPNMDSSHSSDIFEVMVISKSFSRSMYNGYHSGKTAAESSSSGSSSSSGGGGSSSSSGGGSSSSGGGGAGGR